tara:strand:+ start:313 stop:786 length:474 start_codon:yes stop_codon:yes gene_type:complete
MAVDITWNTTFRDRVRLLAGIEQVELDNATLDILSNISAEWFSENVGTAFVLNDNNTYDNAVMYYTCYLGAMAQNGIGIERIQVGDLAVYYEADQYIHFKELAEQQLVMKMGLSIKTTTYNANPWTGNVNWKKNVVGVDSTKNMYPVPRGTRDNGGY